MKAHVVLTEPWKRISQLPVDFGIVSPGLSNALAPWDTGTWELFFKEV